jgi:hypothetical protein
LLNPDEIAFCPFNEFECKMKIKPVVNGYPVLLLQNMTSICADLFHHIHNNWGYNIFNSWILCFDGSVKNR